jgi:hypothetical protein
MQHRDGIAGADRIALVFEQSLEAAGGEGTEPDFSDLHRAGDGEGIARATAGDEEAGRGEG